MSERYNWLLPVIRINKSSFDLILKKFLFTNTYYLKIQGCTVGTPLAASYADQFMGKFEIFYNNNNNTFKTNIKYWARYTDDSFMFYLELFRGQSEWLPDLPKLYYTILFYNPNGNNKNCINFQDVQLQKRDKCLSVSNPQMKTFHTHWWKHQKHESITIKAAFQKKKRLAILKDTSIDKLILFERDFTLHDNWLQEVLDKVSVQGRDSLLKPQKYNKLTYNKASMKISLYLPLREPIISIMIHDITCMSITC